MMNEYFYFLYLIYLILIMEIPLDVCFESLKYLTTVVENSISAIDQNKLKDIIKILVDAKKKNRTVIVSGMGRSLESILIVSMLIVGGVANNKGAILGALILILLPEPLRFIGLPSSMVGALRQMIYAVLLVILVIKKPQGILGEFRKDVA